MYVLCRHHVNMGLCQVCKPTQFHDSRAMHEEIEARDLDYRTNFSTGITLVFKRNSEEIVGLFDKVRRKGWLLPKVEVSS